jgi:tryptophan-rich sensory protein
MHQVYCQPGMASRPKVTNLTLLPAIRKSGLAWNVGCALLAALLGNGLVFLVNPQEMSSDRQTPLTPPGYVIGVVWTGLFICMGLARWNLVRSREDGAASAAPIVWLAILCLAYPVYTGGLRSQTIGLIGNVVTLVFTLGVIASIFPKSRTAAFLNLPVALWLAYATFLTALAVRPL